MAADLFSLTSQFSTCREPPDLQQRSPKHSSCRFHSHWKLGCLWGLCRRASPCINFTPHFTPTQTPSSCLDCFGGLQSWLLLTELFSGAKSSQELVIQLHGKGFLPDLESPSCGSGRKGPCTHSPRIWPMEDRHVSRGILASLVTRIPPMWSRDILSLSALTVVNQCLDEQRRQLPPAWG